MKVRSIGKCGRTPDKSNVGSSAVFKVISKQERQSSPKILNSDAQPVFNSCSITCWNTSYGLAPTTLTPLIKNVGVPLIP